MRYTIIFMLCTISLGSISAQSGPDDEKIESLRIAFLTKYLDLSPEESQVFWPVFNNMQKEMESLHNQYDIKRSESPDFDAMNESQLNDFINKQIDHEQKMLDIRKKYIAEYKKVLPLKKVAMLGEAEQVFKRELLKAAKDKRGGPGGPPPGPGNIPNP